MEWEMRCSGMSFRQLQGNDYIQKTSFKAAGQLYKNHITEQVKTLKNQFVITIYNSV